MQNLLSLYFIYIRYYFEQYSHEKKFSHFSFSDLFFQYNQGTG